MSPNELKHVEVPIPRNSGLQTGSSVLVRGSALEIHQLVTALTQINDITLSFVSNKLYSKVRALGLQGYLLCTGQV